MMTVLNFDGVAIRTRRADQCRAGPDGTVGWFVGKQTQECLAGHNWSDGILLGFDDAKFNFYESEKAAAENGDLISGIMGNPARVVASDDAAIFLCIKSQPSLGNSTQSKHYAEKGAKELKILTEGPDGEEAPVALDLQKVHQLFAKETVPKHVIICGWRKEWDLEPERLTELVEDMDKGLPNLSTVTFLNLKDHESFGDVMVAKGVFRFNPEDGVDVEDATWGTQREGSIMVHHFCGDPVEYEDVESVLGKRRFDVGICLGSVSGKKMPPEAQDSRVLTMLLILRDITAEKNLTMHVIAENEMEQTSGLALAPSRGKSHEPDFVNTQVS